MRDVRHFFFVLLVSLIFLPSLAQAQGNNVSLRLLPERGVVGAGDEMWIAIEQSIKPDWHTYWVNPGDSGAAPKVKWSAPEGFKFGPIQWPVPEKILYEPLVNYGYEGNVVLLQRLQTPSNLPEGEITLSADYEILVCQEECIPEYGTLELSLNGPGAMEEDNSAYIARALEELPVPYEGVASYRIEDGDFVFEMEADAAFMDGVDAGDVAVFPVEWGLVDNMAQPQAVYEDGQLTLRQKAGERDVGEVEESEIVLTLGDERAVSVTAEHAAGVFGAPADMMRAEGFSVGLLVQALGFALIGGVILNLMPCVFPVLSMKALSLVNMSEKERSHAQAHGLAYTLGVVLSFLAMAGILIALKAAGEEIGWGFQLQDPFVVGILLYVLFAVGLNLAGFFEVPGGFANAGSKLAQQQGLSGSFFTGVLAALVAAPCTAPFMAAAIGYALAQPAAVALAVFAALGFGLALPYLLLSYIPALQRVMPRPGAWMETFRQFLAFPMFGATVWLLWVLSQQAGPMGVLAIGIGLVLLAFAIWLFKVARGRRLVQLLAVIVALGALAVVPGQAAMEPSEMGGAESAQAGALYEVYSPAALEAALESDDPVFVEMTAAWCITCKVNHKTSINIDRTRRIIGERGVRYLVGDWTNQDAEITKFLQSYGRNGVPLYVYYGRPDPDSGKRPEPVLLPQILTPGVVAEYLDQ